MARILKWQRSIIVSLLSVGMAASTGFAPALAYSVSANQNVTVGLLFRTSAFDTSVDTVHFKSATGLTAGFNTPSNGFIGAYTQSGRSGVAVSLDDAFVIAGETTTSSQAHAWEKALTASGYNADVMVSSRAGQTIYRVVQGYYETVAGAQAAVSSVSRITGTTAMVGGWNRLSTGSYTTITDATAEVKILQAKGFDAYVAAHVGGNGPVSYNVWIGDQASTSELTSLQAKVAAAVPGISLATASEEPNYVLIKQDAIWADASGTPAVEDHLYIESTSEKLLVQPTSSGSATPLLSVDEKSGQRYRGQMILQGYRQRLAVVNQLPLDSYLYGVVPQEMSTQWPTEALKTQAVSARTYVLRSAPDAFGVCQVADSTYSQAYMGYDREATDTNAAVDATHGQVLLYDNGTPGDTSDDVLAEALYSSNHGGESADSATEAFGSAVPYLRPVATPYDQIEQQLNEPIWYRVELSSGLIGYVRHDLVTLSGQHNAVGFQTGSVSVDTANVRATPNVFGTVEQTVAVGTSVIILSQEYEYGPYAWQVGPYTSLGFEDVLNNNMPSADRQLSRPVQHLSLLRGPSGRVISVAADGQQIPVPDPWYISQLFGDVNSTLFDVEETATIDVQGSSGSALYPDAGGGTTNLHVLSATGPSSVDAGNGSFVVVGANQTVRVATIQPSFVIHGQGYGHGLGMSQWGAYGMAKAVDSGGKPLYTYIDILQHYYTKDCYVTPKVDQ